MFWWKYRYELMDEASDSGGGGSGNAGSGGDSKGSKAGEGDGKDNKASEALTRENSDLKALLAKFQSGDGSNSNSSDLAERTKREREANDKRGADHKTLESAITFNLTSSDFLKRNAALLPESVKDLFTVSDKESYDSPIQKTAEIKSGLIQEFFQIQTNMDLLTQSQRAGLADFLKLTKDGKREKAQQVYDNIFEPALEMMRAVKKSEQVNRARNGYGDDTDASYKEKLIGHSRQHYLGEKKNGT